MTNTRFRQTEIGEIPEDWEMVKLEELLKDEDPGVWGDEDRENGTAVLRSTNFQKDGYISYDSVAYRKIPQKILENKRLKFGNILLERSGGGPDQPVGRVAFFNKKGVIYTFGNFIQRLVPDEEETDPFFLFSLLHYTHLKGYTRRLQQQTTGIRNLDYKSYLRIKVPLPPLPEQKKIAEILSTADEDIQKTDEVTIKTQELKKGLMQKLLARGIGHTKFKKTEIGGIPESWEVMKLGEVVKFDRGISWRKDEKGPGVRVLTIPSVGFDGNIDLNNYTCIKKDVKEGDLLVNGDILVVSSSGSPKHIGRSALFKTESLERYVYASFLTRLKPIERKTTDIFIFHVVNSNLIDFKKFINKSASGLNNLSLPTLKSLKIPLPPLAEQERIAEILSKVDEKIETERSRKQKLEELKKGLMQNLLTGKIRVRIN